ncbi:MAG: hypothetical protein ABIV21_02960, partial [Pyrinomonadaceae bacterium]
LFEAAVFNDEELKSMSEPFTEADLSRFFNSLCETEASLREAVHPRYVLEIGLVKLIEMRHVASIESILERLEALTAGVPLPEDRSAAAATSSASTSPEKKTLKTESTHQPAIDEPPDDDIGVNEDVFLPPSHDTLIINDPPRSRQVMVRLPPLSSEDLEHVEDKRLDEIYEEELVLNGDDLALIKNIDGLVSLLLGVTRVVQTPPIQTASTNGAAAAPAKEVPDVIQETSASGAPPAELPTLGDQPTEDELLEYARAHPSVAAAIRVFRAKIVEVERR